MNDTIARTVTNEPATSDYDSNLPLFTPSPSYSNSLLTCSNTYCHGYFKNGNTTNSPAWAGGSDAAKCGTCST
ncbi:MAG: CxxxxCH/CxxCH domain-containing protein [Bacteroidota bacterium]|nr:CxxxxCH/CxxCH domain-containing protein [Bacteroidota bacterium]